MKLGDYLPEVPQFAQSLVDLNQQVNMLSLMKSTGDTGEAPTIGLDHVVNTWVRHQMAYRQQLVQDLQTVCMTVQEVRTPLHHITSEVFRRGILWKPKVENPDDAQKERFAKFLVDCNIFDQSLEEVLRQFHFDVNSIDDGFLYLHKEYKHGEDGKLRSKVKEIRRLNPALVEFDLDVAGLPKNAHFICPIHREELHESRGKCTEPDCGLEMYSVMYKYYHRNQHIYLFDDEVIHLSKFSPSETYGWSPLLTIFEKTLTLIGMDKNLYRYFFERKMPASMLMVTTDDPESLRRERAHIAAQTRVDPNYIPMVAVSARSQRGRVDLVRLFHTLQEMDYLPVREEIRERIASMWGVTPAWQGAPEAFGGLSTQTQQLVVMSRVVESDQRLFQEKVFPKLLEAFGITDWELDLPNPEEKAEATKLSFIQQRAQIVTALAGLGFTMSLKEQEVDMLDAEFIISGNMVPSAEMAGEAQAMEVAQQEQQFQLQQMQMEQQAEGGGEQGGGMPMQAMLLKAEGKYNGRTGGITPDASMKLPGEERDIDEYAEARERKASERMMGLRKNGKTALTKTWVGSLLEKGFTAPIVKELSPDAKKLWFTNDGIHYVADLGGQGNVLAVEKATFSRTDQNKGTNPSVSYQPAGRNNPFEDGIYDEDEEE